MKLRSASSVNLPEGIFQDLRYALRTLRNSPGFMIVVVLTLALGIGADTAIFSVVEGVILAPLPYREPDRLVMVLESNLRFPLDAISYPNFQDWQRSAHSFQQMAAVMEVQGFDLTAPGTPEHLSGYRISSGFFGTLGENLALGREFSAGEDRQGGAPVVIISNRLWKDRFAGSPQVLGQFLTLDGVGHTIIGVTQPGFRLLSPRDLYTPLGQGDPLVLNSRGSHDAMLSIARLNAGLSISQAAEEMGAIQAHLDLLYPKENRGTGTTVVPLKHMVIGDVDGTLLLLLGAVGLVLLIACANVANLLLARSAARAREFAVRSALGASRSRIVRQLLTESVLLSLAGGILGVLSANWGVKLALAAVSFDLPRTENISIDAAVLLFALGVSIAVGILFGLAPALKSSRLDSQSALKEGGRGFNSVHGRAQSSFVIVQIALTLVLLVSAGLLIRTVQRLWESDPGFDTRHTITFKVGVSRSLTRTAESTRLAYQQLMERIRNVPGVQAADFTDLVPLGGRDADMPFWIGSEKPASLQDAPRLLNFLTGPDYLKTMGIPLLRGRFFTMEDTTKSPCVMVIDSVFARMYFPKSDPLGQTLSAGFEQVGPCQIVGVVGHVKHWGLGGSTQHTQNQMYFPLYQDPDQWVPSNYADLTVVVRTPLDASTIMLAIKAAVNAAASDQPVYDIRTMQQIASESMSSQRFPMILLGAFAFLALLLASVGIYGVISYSVTQRVHEIGVRMALGADQRSILAMVVGHGLRLAVVGVAIGATAGLILTRLLSSFSRLLYGVGGSDPATFVSVSAVLIGVAILACYLPAHRATRVDPMAALRHE
jgi:putative ABC transport system permease protein